MTPDQRKVMKQGLQESSTCTSALKEKSSNPNAKKISIEWCNAHITHLQLNRIADLWRKAEEILNTPNFIVPAAGNMCSRQVASISGACSSKGVVQPHFVYSKKSGAGNEVHCYCSIYSSTPNLCLHSLAAAEDMGVINDYLAWVRKTKAIGLNLSNLISNELPKSAGKKGSTSRRKGAAKGKKRPIVAERDGIVCSSYSPPSPSTTTSVSYPSSPSSLSFQNQMSSISSSSPMPMLSSSPSMFLFSTIIYSTIHKLL